MNLEAMDAEELRIIVGALLADRRAWRARALKAEEACAENAQTGLNPSSTADEGRHEGRCDRCKGPNPANWHAPSPLWNTVMRIYGGDERYPFCCPTCFVVTARELGIESPNWHLSIDGMDIASLWTDADGRTWDAAKCLWVEREPIEEQEATAETCGIWRCPCGQYESTVMHEDGRAEIVTRPVAAPEPVSTLPDGIIRWQREAFPNATAESSALHLAREAHELVSDPHDAEEMADCLFMLLQVADRSGVDLWAAAARKLEVNRAREWQEPDASGIVEHVR